MVFQNSRKRFPSCVLDFGGIREDDHALFDFSGALERYVRILEDELESGELYQHQSLDRYDRH